MVQAKALRNSGTETPVTSLDEVVEVTPRVVKRRAQPDQIFADTKNSRSHFRWVPIGNIRVDPRYQRTLQRKKIVQMAHNWNPDKFGAIVLSLRDDGFFYMIDGQHRWEALNLIENKPADVWAQVFKGLTLQEEAQLFHDLDSERDNLTPGASFKALVVAEDPVAQGIQRAAAKAGMTADYDKGPTPGNVRAFETLKAIYRRQGEAGLARILTICHSSWPDNAQAASAPLMRGLEVFLSSYGDQVDDKRLVLAFSRVDPNYIINVGRQLNGTLTSAIQDSVAIAIRMQYNKKLQPSRRLPENTLVRA